MDLNSPLHFSSSVQEELLIYEDESSFALGEESFVEGEFVGGEFGQEGHVAEYHERNTILVDGGEHYGVSAVKFDSHEELLWMGNQGGHVTSYYGSDLVKYTSFQVHATEEVRSIETIDSGILALTPSSLRVQMRRGIPIFTHTSENMQEMQCVLPLKKSPDSLLLGGHTNMLIKFNLHHGREVQTMVCGDAGCAILREQGKFVACGDPTGCVELRDPLTLKSVGHVETHTGSLSDLDLHNNLLVTCGFSSRPGGNLLVDNYLLVFDLRMMRPAAPISLLLDPLLLRFMPSFSSRLAVASPSGQMQLVETVALSEHDMTVYQVDTGGSAVTALDVSTLCQAVVVGDGGGSLHLMTSTPSPTFNPFSRPTEFADPVEPYPHIDIDDALAIYSAIPLHLPADDPHTPLLSDWPPQFIKKKYRCLPPVDNEILRTMKMQGTIGYAPNPNTRRRNQIPDWYLGGGGPPSVKSAGRGMRAPGDPSLVTASDDGSFIAIPKRYRKLDTKFFKPTDDLSELEQYNKTGLSGLEATLPNSYCNAMIQVLYFTDVLRQVVCAHTCSIEFCVTCELGFLFHMLGSSRGGAPCHSGNLLRALRSAKEASALRLILPDSHGPQDANLAHLIQSWNRFILHQMHSEMLETKRKAKEPRQAFVYKDTDFPSIDPAIQRKRKIKPELTEEIIEDTTKGETEISRLFGSKQSHMFTCLKCKNKTSKEATLLAHNLSYPNPKVDTKEVSFCEVLKNSVCGSQVTPAWCETCHKFQPTLQERSVKSLPHILSINCGNNSESERKFWKEQMDNVVMRAVSVGLADPRGVRLCRYGAACARPSCRFKHPTNPGDAGGSGPVGPLHLYYSNSWVPSHIRVSLSSQGEISVDKILPAELDSNPLLEDVSQSVVYDLYAVVCYVNDEKKNIVSIINVASPSMDKTLNLPSSQWFIFNDICVTGVSGQEAVWFSMDWKVPCVLYWRQHNMSNPLPLPSAISVGVFSEQAQSVGVTPLSPHEIPQLGDIVAMDAEFVTLNQEESELRSDGKLATIRPSHMSVARISCVRGQGPMEGTPFIDDYISTQEQVFDYLTKFSGIKPGDLDVTCSSKNLTTLKSTYLKVRYLIDNGVKFVGHGLNNDFRVINLVVPPEQIIDTVQLFYIPHQRMVSLRFLAWHFLGLKIQSETHDSVEDARTALQLYKKYRELELTGTLQSALEEMYLLGKSLHWKIPTESNH